MNIGDRVKVIDQEITGTIIDYDVWNKVVILGDDDSWCEENEEPRLVFRLSDLEEINYVVWVGRCDDYFTTYQRAKEHYEEYIEQGYDDVHLMEVSDGYVSS